MQVEIREERVLNMDTMVARFTAAGMVAYVAQTGGGCATIYASRTADAYGTPHVLGEAEDLRSELIAGPGWFEGPGFSNGRASVEEFAFGPDDDGVTYPQWAHADDTDDSLSERMIAMLKALA